METTAKNFAMQLGALAALYVSVTSLVVMLFSIINIHFPDAAAAYYEYDNAQSSIRFTIAILLVFLPTYITLTRLVNKSRRSASNVYLVLTKWLIYLSLLVGGFVLLGDLVSVVYTFLNGELTTRFLLKATSLLIVVGAAFYYYLQDAKNYWNNHEKLSTQLGALTTAVVVGVVIFGYYSIDAPSKVREISIDQNQISDLQDMQWRIEEYYAKNNTLPTNMVILYVDSIAVPEAPTGREPYSYQVTGDTTYKLCATFVEPTPTTDRSIAKPLYEDPIYYQNQSWEHGVGEKCFERVAQTAKAITR